MYSAQGMNLTCGNVKTQGGASTAALINRMLLSSAQVSFYFLSWLLCSLNNVACGWMWENSEKGIEYQSVHTPTY